MPMTGILPFTSIAGIFDKIFPSEEGKIQAMFDDLAALGYSKIPSTDAPLQALMRQLKPLAGSLFVVKRAMWQQRGVSKRYICDLQMKLASSAPTNISSWTVFLQNQALAVGKPITICPKELGYEMLFKHAQKESDLTVGLHEDFAGVFYAFSKSGGDAFIPENLQEGMIPLATTFPFNGGSKSIGIAHFSVRGWSIMCDSVKNSQQMNTLITTADRVEKILESVKP